MKLTNGKEKGGPRIRGPPYIKHMKYWLKIIAISIAGAALLVGVLVSALNIHLTVKSTRDADSTYSSLQNEVREPENAALPAESQSPLPTIDWQQLKATCPDVVGWLYCPDTPLDYPVVRTDNNDTYLTHLATGEANSHGAIFADYRCGPLFTDDNTLIYGHNMKDGTMFHCLINWGNADYAAAHPTLYFLTPGATYEISLFSACLTDATSDAYQRRFSGADAKAAWLDERIRSSWLSAEAAPTAEDPIVTFSTCSGENGRFIVQGIAKEIMRGE